MEIFGFENFGFTYSGASTPVLKNLSLSVRRGEILLLYGKSGCGKTTLLRMIKRETAPKGTSSGELRRGFDNENAGFVFQNPEMQIVTDRVWHELAFACESKGWSREKIRRRLAEVSEYFGIGELFRRETATLSGGQKQIVNLAAAVVTEPEVLVLDEPTSRLDPIAAEAFVETIKKLNRDFGITVIMCEHNTENVFLIADRVACMEDGTISAVLPPAEVGGFLRGKPMLGGLPCAARIGVMLDVKEPLPLTASEGKALVRRYENKKSLPERTLCVSDKAAMELKNVSFRYESGGREILRGVSLKIHQGEVISVLGGNGAGKSTLLSVIAGLLPCTGGLVKYFGKRLKSYGARLYRGNIALLPQNPQNCFTRDTLREDWEHMAAMTGFSDIPALARRLKLEKFAESHPYDLSGGQQQLAALGKVLMQRPRLLLMDEPAKGLDIVSKTELIKIIRELSNGGTAVVIVTHDCEQAAEVSDRCGLLFDGELISLSPPEEFFSENIFYTTPAARISRGYFKNAVTDRQIVELCRLNGERHDEQ